MENPFSMHIHHSVRLLAALFAVCFTNCTLAQGGFPLVAEGFDSHVELKWPAQNAVSYRVSRSSDGLNFAPIKNVSTNFCLDFTGFQPAGPAVFQYKIDALNATGTVISASDTVAATVAEASDSALLDMVQRYSFRYFWEFAHPASGMTRERNSSGDIVTTGGTGFGIMALLVGVHRGFISREEGRDRLLQIVGFLGFADKFHGVFPHWMNGNTGNVVPFSQFDNGGDLVETAFLMQGLLAARQFFDENEPLETALRQSITQLWEDVEWDFYRKNGSGVLYWHWSPNYGWQMNFQIRGWNEALIVYLLAVASPTHPVPASLWQTGWTASNYANGFTFFGQKLFVGPNGGGPLFFAHYSFLGFDPRGKKDAFCNYFHQNRAHSLINRAYCASNPKNFAGYGNDCWGLTASDDPGGYLAHEPNNDNGTISPTAALSSMPYTPAESMAALKHFYRQLGAETWGPMGFFDAFNEQLNWQADSYLAIDQGPIVGMIENFRSGLLWDNFMKNPEIQPALAAIGFMPDATPVSAQSVEKQQPGFRIFPNPLVGEKIAIEFFYEKKEAGWLEIIGSDGRQTRRFWIEKTDSLRNLNLNGLPGGPYFLRFAGREIRFLKR